MVPPEWVVGFPADDVWRKDCAAWQFGLTGAMFSQDAKPQDRPPQTGSFRSAALNIRTDGVRISRPHSHVISLPSGTDVFSMQTDLQNADEDHKQH